MPPRARASSLSPAPPFPSPRAVEITAGKLTTRTLATWWSRIWLLAGVTLVVSVLAVAVSMFAAVGLVTAFPQADDTSNALMFLALVFSVYGTALLVHTGAVARAVVPHASGRPVGLGAMLAAGLSRTHALAGAGLLTSLLVAGGFALLVVPGVAIACALAVTVPVVVLERCGPVAAMRRSVRLTKGYRGPILGAFVLLGLAQLGLAAASRLLVLVPIVGPALVVLVHLLAIPIPLALPAVAYHELREGKEGASRVELEKIFE